MSTTAYFASDFTLAEVKTLRAIQTRGRATTYDGQFEIPTLAEVIALAKAQGTATGRTIGIYPEVKHATFRAGIRGNHVFEGKLVTMLHTNHANAKTAAWSAPATARSTSTTAAWMAAPA